MNPINAVQVVKNEETGVLLIPPSGIDLAAQKTFSLAKNQFFLHGPIALGEYGVVGMTIIDRAPIKRWLRYDEHDWTGVGCSTNTYKDDAKREYHFKDTEKGFSILRSFILPVNVDRFFKTDKFLGPATIEKLCREPINEDFDEEPAGLAYSREDTRELRDIVTEALTKEHPNFNYSSGDHSFISFHPWWEFDEATKVATEAISKTTVAFDELLRRFAGKSIDRRTNKILGTNEMPPRPALT